MQNGDSIAAIVVTYNRKDLLYATLCSLHSQTRPLNEIIVVDNASQDGTEAMVRAEFPRITCLQMPENTGPAGGFSTGMQTAFSKGHDWVWLFNDDAVPEPDTLEQCLEQLSSIDDERVGIACPVGVGNQGSKSFSTGIWWRGRPVVSSWNGCSTSVDVDGVTFNGALVSREVLAKVGYPRNDYFMMFEEWEFCLRTRNAGFRVLLLPKVTIRDLKAGSAGASPPWRGYYQTRNHLAMALERRSIDEIFWWSYRQVKFVIGAVLYLDSKRERTRLRALGAWHALRGRAGRTIDPSRPVKR